MMMKSFGMMAAVALASCTTANAQVSPIQAGDLALGLNQGDAFETLQLVRGGALEGNYTTLGFAQSMEFDNANGPHSHGGNLLGLNFGATLTGGSVYSYATNGTDAGEQIYQFDTAMGGVETTRVAGLSVSPDNSRLAILGYDSGSLIILDYAADDGDGSGAAITGATAHTFVTFSGTTQGTAWLDNDTVLMFAVGSFDAELLSINANTGAVSVLTTVPVRFLNTSAYLDIDYNPLQSPYVYCSFSSFSGASQSEIVALDPGTGYSVVGAATLEGSMETAREIALGADGNLYLGSYGGSAAPGPFVEVISADPTAWVNDGTTDYYQAVGVSSSFNGLDVAHTGSMGGGPTLTISGTCPGPVTLTASNVTGGGNVAFLYAFGTGNFVIPGGFTCAGTQLGLNNSVQLGGTSTADGSGVATFSANAPAQACGRVFLQAIDITTCTTTNVEGL